MMAYSTEATNRKVDGEFNTVILSAVQALRDGHLTNIELCNIGSRELLIAKKAGSDEQVVLGKGEPTDTLLEIIEELYEETVYIELPDDITSLPDEVLFDVVLRDGLTITCTKDTLYKGHPEEVGVVIWHTPSGDVKILDIECLVGAKVKINKG